MNARLTLNMEKHLIDSAKEYSARTGKSLSRLVADFFELIRQEHMDKASQLPPIVQSLKGVLKGSAAAINISDNGGVPVTKGFSLAEQGRQAALQACNVAFQASNEAEEV